MDEIDWCRVIMDVLVYVTFICCVATAWLLS